MNINGYIIGPGADLTGLDLTGVDLTDVDLTGVDLTGAIVDGTKFYSNGSSLSGVEINLTDSQNIIIGDGPEDFTWKVKSSANLEIEFTSFDLHNYDG